MNTQIPQQENKFKRNVAYKFRIGQILSGSQVNEDERLKHVKVNEKEVVRVNIIANIVDKFIQKGEKKFGSVTLDDASGQIKLKVFGEDVEKINDFNQGDTVLVIGLLRSWNNEVYITPEIIKKKDPRFLLIRKMETELEMPKQLGKEQMTELKDKIIQMVKDAEEGGGIAIEKIIMDLKEPPEIINQEIKKLLEDGMTYEPRPGKLRYLG